MPRDYKNTRQRNTRAKKTETPKWRGFFSGFGCGVVLTGALVAAVQFDLLRFSGAEPNRPIAQAANGAGSTDEEDVDKPQFEFYTMLPEMEVAVKEEEIEPPAAETSSASAAETEPLAGSYLLQVGSFRKHDEADALKASLALLGLEADIQTVSVNGEETWHRVRIGPFTQRAAFDDARKRLSDNGIEAMVLKKRG